MKKKVKSLPEISEAQGESKLEKYLESRAADAKSIQQETRRRIRNTLLLSVLLHTSLFFYQESPQTQAQQQPERSTIPKAKEEGNTHSKIPSNDAFAIDPTIHLPVVAGGDISVCLSPNPSVCVPTRKNKEYGKNVLPEEASSQVMAGKTTEERKKRAEELYLAGKLVKKDGVFNGTRVVVYSKPGSYAGDEGVLRIHRNEKGKVVYSDAYEYDSTGEIVRRKGYDADDHQTITGQRNSDGTFTTRREGDHGWSENVRKAEVYGYASDKWEYHGSKLEEKGEWLFFPYPGMNKTFEKEGWWGHRRKITREKNGETKTYIGMIARSPKDDYIEARVRESATGKEEIIHLSFPAGTVKDKIQISSFPDLQIATIGRTRFMIPEACKTGASTCILTTSSLMIDGKYTTGVVKKNPDELMTDEERMLDKELMIDEGRYFQEEPFRRNTRSNFPFP